MGLAAMWAAAKGFVSSFGFVPKAATHFADEKLKAENKLLKDQLLDREHLKHDSTTGYVYFDGDEKPYCPKCFYDRDKKIPLAPPIFSQKLRRCLACDYSRTENPIRRRKRVYRLPPGFRDF